MSTRPNILVFMTDQQRADVVEADHPCLTPNLDRFAADGVRFRQVYTPTAHCCPARATFFTGLYPSRHGIFNNIFNNAAIGTSLKPGVQTFGEQLQGAGYRMAFSGKWHVSTTEDPADRGWEELYTTATQGTHHGRSMDDWRALAAQPEPEERQRGTIQRPGWGPFTVYKTLPDGGPQGYEKDNDYKVIRAAVDALPDLAGGDEPWALWVGPIGPHDPFTVPERFVKMYDPAKIDLPASYADKMEDKPRIYQRMRRQFWDQLGEDEVRESIAHYWAYCTMMDALFGEVLAALEATGQADNTLVLFLSDHGDYCGDHGLYLKGVPAFQEAYHVPCVARWPAGICQSGRAVDEFVTLADFAPTFLELAGIEPSPTLTGRSIAPFLRGEKPADWTDTFYSQMNGVELYYSQRVVATKEFKYVYNGFDFDELYDLRTDAHEMHNLADDPAYAAVKRDLVQRMWRFAAAQDDRIFNPYGTVAFAPWGPADGLKG